MEEHSLAYWDAYMTLLGHFSFNATTIAKEFVPITKSAQPIS